MAFSDILSITYLSFLPLALCYQHTFNIVWVVEIRAEKWCFINFDLCNNIDEP